MLGVLDVYIISFNFIAHIICLPLKPWLSHDFVTNCMFICLGLLSFFLGPGLLYLSVLKDYHYLILCIYYLGWTIINLIFVIIEAFFIEELSASLLLLGLSMIQVISASYFLKKEYDIPLGYTLLIKDLPIINDGKIPS